MGRGLWPFTEESRAKVVDRVALNLSKLSFFTEKVISYPMHESF